MSESTIELAEEQHPAPATLSPRAARRALREVVPADPWVNIRLVGFIAFGIAYVWWFFNRGLIIDRISVALSVAIFIVIGHLGRPLRRWAMLVFDVLCYCAMWLIYEESRGWADHAGFPLQVELPRNIDRFLFFGVDPNVWLQRQLFDSQTVHWYDKIASSTYYTHFILPVIAIAVLWVTNHREWTRFIKRFATLLVVACTMFVLMPTVPPWMADDKYRILDPLVRHTGRGFQAMGLKGFVRSWQSALDWGNAVAAMPSLHAGFALFVPAFFLPQIKPKWLKALVLLFPVLMLTSLVYFGEHYVIDGLVAWVIVGLTFLFWGWQEKHQRRRRAARAHAFLDRPDSRPLDHVAVV